MSTSTLVDRHDDTELGLLLRYPDLHHHHAVEPDEARGQMLTAALTSRFGDRPNVGLAAELLRSWADEDAFEAINAATGIHALMSTVLRGS